jgi:flavin-dependent dehydrogenase
VSRVETLVIGGGLAGAGAAARLARGGRPVLVLERSAGPHDKICGEFLSVEAQGYLAELGIDPPALGAAPIDTVRLVHGSRWAESPLPFRAYGLTRRVLDEALLARASELGAEVRRGTKAASIRADGTTPEIVLGTGEVLRAARVLLATGKHDLRGARRDAAGPGDLVGFKTFLALDPRQRDKLDGAIEVVLFEGGYAGLQTVEGGRANLCLLVRKSRLDRVGGWPGLLGSLFDESPHLDRRLSGATTLMERPLAIAGVPYGFVHGGGPPRDAPGLYRLGDQAGVIHSFSGDGMAIALHSGAMAARAVRDGTGASAYHRGLARDIRAQIRLSCLLYEGSRSALGRRALLETARAFPGAMRWVAELTRVPERARRFGEHAATGR